MAPSPDSPTDRIALIHALPEAIAPIHDAFRRGWPEAALQDLLDSSLSVDRAAGCDAHSMTGRFLALARYAAAAHGPHDRTAAILFTCSAFGPQIEAVQRELSVPVAKPNEGAFIEALDRGARIGLLLTFAPSQQPMTSEMEALAVRRGRRVTLEVRVVDGALAALQRGDTQTHDALVARAASELRDVDTVILGQFSMARAASAASEATSIPVVTTADAAVREVRALVASREERLA